MDLILTGPLWATEFFGNTLRQYVLFVAVIAVLSFIIFLTKYFLFRKLSKRIKEQKIFKLFLEVIDKIRSPFYIFVSFYIALSVLQIPELLLKVFKLILIFWVTYRAVLVGYQFIDFFFETYAKKQEGKASKAMIRALGNIAKGFLWVVAFFIILSIFGVNITALVAGMGIGGIAVAFALQNILADLFSSFSIYFDKPFVEGDFIVVGDNWGTVEKIGIKSTRIRALRGEEIVFSNKELTSAKVHNFRKMERRRGEIKIGIVYETPTEKMEKIPSIIKRIMEKEELVELDRVHFSAFNDFSLDYVAVYFVNSSDYKMFLDITERILLDIKREFQKEGIEFAYPTKTIHLTQSGKQ